MARDKVSMDGNSAVAHVAHATNEVIAIYPITPSSNMGEVCDAKSAEGEKNIWGTIPVVVELQSEGGASGAVHGALATGALTTTFTASQGLLLMIPNMHKIAGELLPTVFHVSARSLACQALSIFGDHSDINSVRNTGYGLVSSNSVQEAMDFALIAQAAALESRIPYVHFFDGFRTSHEIQKIEVLTHDDMRAMLSAEAIAAHRQRGMSPDRPVLRGTSANPDVYFQGRESVNRFYLAAPGIMQAVMDRFAGLTGRAYQLFDYVGHPEAERVAVLMGSGAEAMQETVEFLAGIGEKVGVIKVRLYRPWSTEAFMAALPRTARAIAVLDRTKEPGALGEPLYLDVRAAIDEARTEGLIARDREIAIVGGRFGLSSKEFTPGMCRAVLDGLKAERPKNHFTVGIHDDVTHTSLEWDPCCSVDLPDVHRAIFFGLGADGTVGANKNSIKIIGKATDYYAQGFFVYDSKKAGSLTVSHLRFGPRPIRSTYLISQGQFVACHNFSFLEKYDMLSKAEPRGTFLLASPYGKDEVWDRMPREVQQQIIDRKLRFYVIDAIGLAKELGLGARINVIMQTAFFAISGILPREKALDLIRDAVVDTYGSKGQKVVDMNLKAAQAALGRIEQVDYPQTATSEIRMPPPVPAHAPEFVQLVTGEIIAGRGDEIPVSRWPVDGTFPTATTQYEKRNIAVEIPVWEPEACLQCGMCSLYCPHASIRIKAYAPELLAAAPPTFKSIDAKGKQFAGMKFSVQVAPEDCTGCDMCVQNCPGRVKDASGAKTDKRAINMAFQLPLRESERANYEFFLGLPETDPALYNPSTVKGSQLVRPLFEYSGACAGCGETQYPKLLTQLFGDRALIANATGCSSIYGGNLPTTPYAVRADGRGPTWNNSLFEDAAELGLGMRLTSDKLGEFARELAGRLVEAGGCRASGCICNLDLMQELLAADQSTQSAIEAQRARVARLKQDLADCDDPTCRQLLSVADFLVKRSVWILGGDGWAYDIGFGGLDHVMASGRDVNALVLDTEVYSNTGGQCSKATPRGATARFAEAGKSMPKKDLGMMFMTYGNVYVARVAIGANPAQAVRAFVEAESYDGPSIIIAYCHCIAHGIDMATAMGQQKKAVDSGYWPLFRFDPRLIAQGKNPLQFDSKSPTLELEQYVYSENRYRSLLRSNPERAARLLGWAKEDVRSRFLMYQQLAKIPPLNELEFDK